jgi:SH3 domain protein
VNKNVKKIIFLQVFLLLSNPLFAKTMYITDSFEAPLRTGQTSGYRILAYPKSGSALEVLEVNDETGYTKVRTRKGTEGWVQTHFLINTPIAKHRLLQVQKQLDNLKNKNKLLSSDQSTANKTASELSDQNKTLQNSNAELERELNYVKEVSGNSVQINERNQQLVEEHQQLKNEFDLLNSDNERLKDNANSQYFLMGAGAILLGIILGLLLPSLKPKRKDSGWV